jgi:hypothetical protein
MIQLSAVDLEMQTSRVSHGWFTQILEKSRKPGWRLRLSSSMQALKRQSA